MADQRQKRIFVVDDERVIAETLATILERSGFSAQCFFNPLEALHAARSDAPDLLISDVMMPQLSGVELAVQIKGLWPLCQVLLFSGQAGNADLLQGARKQGHDFRLLSKPVHPSDLLREIQRQEP